MNPYADHIVVLFSRRAGGAWGVRSDRYYIHADDLEGQRRLAASDQNGWASVEPTTEFKILDVDKAEYDRGRWPKEVNT